jgi:hypothetical protein
MQAFRNAGFEVGHFVANNFPITAPAIRFRKDRRVTDLLPNEMQQLIETIIFPESPAFGPGGNYWSIRGTNIELNR